jgi:hypothetical protein
MSGAYFGNEDDIDEEVCYGATDTDTNTSLTSTEKSPCRKQSGTEIVPAEPKQVFLSQQTIGEFKSTEEYLTDKYKKQQGTRFVPRNQSVLARAAAEAIKSATKSAYQKDKGSLTHKLQIRREVTQLQRVPTYYFSDPEDKESCFKHHKVYHTPSGLINHS